MRIPLLAIILFSVTLATRAEAQFSVSNPAPAENFHVELGLMFWQPTPGIEIQTGGLAAAGIPAVDFVREFGLLDEYFMEFRSVVKAGRKHKFRVSHVTFEYNETAPVTRDISFGGVTFPITIPVTADLNWDLWRFGYEYDFVAGDRGLLGFITELKRNHVTADLSSIGFQSQKHRCHRPDHQPRCHRSRLSSPGVLHHRGVHRLQSVRHCEDADGPNLRGTRRRGARLRHLRNGQLRPSRRGPGRVSQSDVGAIRSTRTKAT